VKKSINSWWIKIIILILILLLLGVSIYSINRYYSSQDGRVYEIVSEELNGVTESSDNTTITGGSIFSQRMKDLGKSVTDAMNNAKTRISNENPLIPKCENIIDSKTGNFDILFIGDGYNSMTDLRNDANKLMNFDGKGNYPGLFSIEPFKTYKYKFDVRGMRYNVGTANINEKYSEAAALAKLNSMLAAKLVEKTGCPETDYIIVLSKYDFRSVCLPNLACLVSIRTNVDSTDGALVTHEFAHDFAGLADEYTDPMLENLGDIRTIAKKITGRSYDDELDLFSVLGINSPPNCRKTRSSSEGFVYTGCGFSRTNYKPSSNSIMGDLRYSSQFNKQSRDRIEDILNGRFSVLKSNSILRRI